MDPDTQPAAAKIDPPPGPRTPQRRQLPIAPARIRSKLIFLHTIFSLALAAILLLALRAPVANLVAQSARHESRWALSMLVADPSVLASLERSGLDIESGDAASLGLTEQQAARARASGESGALIGSGPGERIVGWDAGRSRFISVEAPVSTATQQAVNRLYLALILALLAVYALIALALEVFVLPKQVYRPIERLRAADLAVQEGRRTAEMIPDTSIPTDELGQVMRSRNESIRKLRDQETQLEEALERVESIAAELRRKNHLLEAARQNLADQDRLASLGMMSAGIAHELNTPLAVIKGCVDDLRTSGPDALPAPRIELMHRVVSRLERLSESLLDFARVRPPASTVVPIAGIVDEAWSLVSLDRHASPDDLTNTIPAGAVVVGDADRLTQVFVNLLRNAVDAMEGSPVRSILVACEQREREGRSWLSITITDSGPGISPELLDRLFEPFASTHLDAHGTGLGLAVAEGIVREHGGVIIGRNAPDGGARFEVMLPGATRREGLNDAGIESPGAGTLSGAPEPERHPGPDG